MQQEPIEATSLDDLGDTPFSVTLERPDGKLIKVKLRALSEAEIWKIRRSIVYPNPPVKDIQKIQGEVLETFDYLNPDYIKGTQDGNRQLSRRVLASMFTFPIAGDTLDEKAAEIEKKLGNWAYELLVGVATRVNSVTKEQVDKVMHSFRLNGQTGNAGDASARADAGTMVELVEG